MYVFILPVVRTNKVKLMSSKVSRGIAAHSQNKNIHSKKPSHEQYLHLFRRNAFLDEMSLNPVRVHVSLRMQQVNRAGQVQCTRRLVHIAECTGALPIILCKSGFPKYRALPRATSLSRLLITRRVTNTSLEAQPFSPSTKYTSRMLLYTLTTQR